MNAKTAEITQTVSAEPLTDAQATDEAVLLLTRKLRRLHPAAFRDIVSKLPQGARDALTLAENRADAQRSADQAAGVARRYVTIAERCESTED